MGFEDDVLYLSHNIQRSEERLPHIAMCYSCKRNNHMGVGTRGAKGDVAPPKQITQ